jgi:hypothetical protein
MFGYPESRQGYRNLLTHLAKQCYVAVLLNA